MLATQETQETTEEQAPATQPRQLTGQLRGLRPFDSERAREAGRKGLEARRRKAQEAEAERVAQRDRDTAALPDYVAQRIARTRAHIEALDERLESAFDPKDIKAIADAIAKLQDTERILSGRPLPGQLKPKPPGRTRETSVAAPVD